ncbi:MAG: hypothetical protein AAF206_08155 [Bacteroidota bacterium]
MKHTLLFLFIGVALNGYAQEKPEYVCSLDSSVSFFQLEKENRPVFDRSVSMYLDKVIDLFLPNNRSAQYTVRDITSAPIAAAHHQRIGNEYPRVITLNTRYFSSLVKTAEDRKALFIWILAHELTHHISGDNHYQLSGIQANNLMKEILADERAGFAVGKLTDVDISFFKRILPKVLRNDHATASHPGKSYRIIAAEAGWMDAKLADPGASSAYTEWTSPSGVRYDKTWWRARSKSQRAEFRIVGHEVEGYQDLYAGHRGRSPRMFAIIHPIKAHHHLGRYQHHEPIKIYFGEGSANLSGVTPHGKGKMFLTNGDSYIGAFADGEFEGFGIQVEANGSTYKGQWKSGRKHGAGILIKDGLIISKGCWENDRFKRTNCR